MSEIKNLSPFDGDVFGIMVEIAKSALENAKKEQYTQAIVLLTSKGEKYCSVIANAISVEKTDEKQLIDQLMLRSDTQVCHVLSMWHDGCVDLPSFAFRKMLCQLNADNLNAGIFVMKTNGYSSIKLETTIKI